MLDFLDAPRSALWNLGRGVTDLVSGNDSSAADFAPGLAGLAIGGGLAATGAGLPLSLLLGSLMGGFGQEMVGKQAMRPGELLSKYAGIDENSDAGMLGSIALSMATDPLTFAGGGFGLKPTPNMLAPMAEGRLGRLATQDIGYTAGNRLDKLAGQYNDLTRTPHGLPDTPSLGWSGPARSEAIPLGYNPDSLLMSQAPDILRGRVPGGQDLGSLSEMLRAAGGQPERLLPVMEQGASRDIIEQMRQQALPSFHFKPKVNYKGMELPEAAGYQLPISESHVPVDPAMFMEAIQRQPTLMDDLLKASTADPGALTVRPPRIVPDDISGMRLNYETRQKRIAESLAEMLQMQQGM